MANEFKVKKGLIVNGSGSVILDVRGSQGQLFSVTDNLSGSLFSVADISGVPVFDVFSSGRVGIGTSNPAERLHVYGGNVLISGSSAGTELKVQDGASGAPIRLSSNGSGEAFLYIGGENSSLRRTGGDLNLFANNLDIKLSTNNGSTATLFLDTSHNASFAGYIHSQGRVRIQGGTDNGSQLNLFCDSSGDAHLSAYTFSINTGANNSRTESLKIDHNKNATFAGSVKPSGSAVKDLGGASNRWATVYAANVNTSTSSTFGHNIVLDDNVDHSPEIQWINQDNESWEMYNNSSGKFQIEQGGNSRIELSSDGLELKNEGRLILQSGSASDPAITFLSASATTNGIYREAYDTNKSQISIATEGTRRVRINEAGIFSDVNVYATGDFRSFANPWHATQGTAGAGFRFENTADSRILFDIAGTGNSVLYTVSTMAPSLTFGATAGQRLRTENSEFAFGLSNVTPHPLFIQGRNHTNGSRHIVLQPKGGNIGIGVDGSGANIDTLLHLAQSSTPVIKLERPGNAAIRLGVSGTDFAISRTSDTLASGNVMIIDDNYNTTFSGSVRSNGLTTDGNAKFYAWRAVDNTSNTENEYYKIARISGSQSTRFRIDLTGRSTSYSDPKLPAIGSIVGQLNNDNCYDIIFYNNTNISASTESEVAKSVGQVRVSNTATDIYLQLGQYAEIAATAVISDTFINTFSNNASSGSTQPEGFTASFETKMLNTSNFTGAGIGVAGSGTTSRVPKFTGGSTLGDSVITSTAAGNVGIGITTPGSKLSIEANTGTGLLVNMTGSGGGRVFAGGGASYYNNLNLPASAPFYIATSGSTSSAPALSMGGNGSAFVIQASAGIVTGVAAEELLINPSGGNVGIGTNSPLGRLHVTTGDAGSITANTNHDDLIIEGSGNAGINIFSPAGNNYQYLAFGDSDGANRGYVRYYHGTDQMVLRAGGTDTVYINNGRVGIGTATTSVGGLTYKTFINGGNVGIAGKIRFGEEVAGFGQYSTKGTGQLHALTSKTAYGQTGSGNGTVALVNETGTTATGITVKNTSTGNSSTLFSIFRNNNTGTSGAFSGGGGSPFTLLKITGQADMTVGYNTSFSAVRAENFYSYGGGTTYYLKLNSTTTSLNARGDVIAFASSDIRMKEDIKPLDNPLEKLDKIKGVKFKWNDIHKDFKGKKDIGVIAQDVEKVLPEIVTTRDTGYKAVDYQKLSVLLIESVKELKKEVEELKKKINK